MRIRPATVADLPAIVDIQNAFLDSTTWEWTEVPHTVESRVVWLEQKDAAGHPVLVAVEDDDADDVLGFAAYGDFRDSVKWPGYRFVVEHTVHVAERAWGRGIGRALLDALAEHARAAGKWVLVAAVDGSNQPSIDFHLRLGFDEVARMPGIGEKWGQRCDLVLLQRQLS